MFSRCTIHEFTGNAVGSLQIGFLFRMDIDIVWKGHRFSQPDKPGKLLDIILTFYKSAWSNMEKRCLN